MHHLTPEERDQIQKFPPEMTPYEIHKITGFTLRTINKWRNRTFTESLSHPETRRKHPEATADYNPSPTPRIATPTLPEPRLPPPCAEAGGPGLPKPLLQIREPLQVDNAGWWLVIGDTHIPMHDCRTIELAFDMARERNAVGVLFNGDIGDMFSMSPFWREPTKEKFIDELSAQRQFFSWARSRLPRARMIFRQGNHEFRMTRFIVSRAAELYELPEIRLENLLGLANLGIEWVQDKRRIDLGKLPTLHGHELRKGEGINPARLAFLRATAPLLVNHHHRTSEHHQRALDGRHFATWSVGCACYLSPDYDPYNQWNLGFAMVDLASDGWYHVENRRVIGGRVV